MNKFINLELNNIKNKSYQIETVQSLIEEKNYYLKQMNKKCDVDHKIDQIGY